MTFARNAWHLLRYVTTHPATRHRPARAIGRVLWYQARRRFTRQPLRAGFVNGSVLLVFPGRPAVTAAYYVGLPDFEDMLFVLHLMQGRGLFIDGGANVGVWTVLIGSAGSEVIAIEPVPATFALLEQQIAANRFGGRVQAVRVALAAANGVVRMTTDLDVGNRVDAAGGTTDVPAVTLDALTAGRPPTVIKLDLEGYELEALRGGEGVLGRPDLLAVLCETFRTHNWQAESLRQTEQLLARHGFTAHRYDPHARVLSPLPGLDCPPPDAGQNTIYVRDAAAVAARLRDAPAGTTGGQW